MAYRVRVFRNPDDTIQVMHPAQKGRMAGETDEAFFARVVARTLEANPRLVGLDWLDCQNTDIPADRQQQTWPILRTKVPA